MASCRPRPCPRLRRALFASPSGPTHRFLSLRVHGHSRASDESPTSMGTHQRRESAVARLPHHRVVPPGSSDREGRDLPQAVDRKTKKSSHQTPRATPSSATRRRSFASQLSLNGTSSRSISRSRLALQQGKAAPPMTRARQRRTGHDRRSDRRSRNRRCHVSQRLVPAGTPSGGVACQIGSSLSRGGERRRTRLRSRQSPSRSPQNDLDREPRRFQLRIALRWIRPTWPSNGFGRAKMVSASRDGILVHPGSPLS